MRIQVVDPADEPTFRRWFGVRQAATRRVLPSDPLPTWSDSWGAASDRSGNHLRHYLLAVGGRADGPVDLGAAVLTAPMHDNAHLAELQLGVAPGARRRGIGTALLAAAESWLADAGRTTLELRLFHDVRGPGPDEAFAAARGFRCGHRSDRRDLAVPAPAGFAMLDASTAAAVEEAGAADYAIRCWRGGTPDDLLADRAVLSELISADDPSDGLDYEVERWDAARQRADDEVNADRGQLLLSAGAICRATGELVGVTTIGAPTSQPEWAFQWDTVVGREHRGHRLGRLMKVANLHNLAAASPATRRVVTWNATDNTPMIAVNEALGAQVVGGSSGWQKRA